MSYLYLIIAIAAEVVATSALKESAEFSKPLPSIISIISYSVAFYFLSLTLKTIPLGITYAIWAGVGIVSIALVGAFVYKQIPDLPAMLGMGLIVVGVVVINVFSKTISH
jgi:small multidrug resistance pump